MPIRPEISLGVQQPKLIGAQDVLTLQNLAQQGETQRFKLEEMQRARTQSNELRKLIAENTGPSGQVNDVALGSITALDPQVGQMFAKQNEMVRLRDLQNRQQREDVAKRVGTAYVSTYDDLVQKLGGNQALATQQAQRQTVEAIDEMARSGELASIGLGPDDIARLKNLKDPESTRTIVMALGGSLSRPKSEGFTLSEGQQRFDAQGRRIAFVPKPPEKPEKTAAAPAGYRFTASGDLEAIPGGPADVKAGEAAVKAERSAEMAATKADVVTGTVDAALKQLEKFQWFGADVPGSGLRRKVGSMIAGTDAYDLEQTINTVKANLGFKELADMRAASPTGGALGQIAVRELEFLQAAVAALDVGQSQQQLRENLKKIKTHFEKWKETTQAKASPRRRASDRDGALTPEEQAELDQLRKRFGSGR